MTGRAVRVMERMGEHDRSLSYQSCDQNTEAGPTHAERCAQWIAYQSRVIAIFCQERTRLNLLAGNNSDAWLRLYEQLARTAYRALDRRGAKGTFAFDKAAELAQQTCERVFVSVFPCDVPFDLWVSTILKNLILQYLTRSQDLLDRESYVNSLDDSDETAIGFATTSQLRNSVTATVHDIAIGTVEIQAIIEALEQMRSHDRRAVIVYTYFAGLSDDEIADRLGRSKGVVQTLRHRALRQLRGIFEE